MKTNRSMMETFNPVTKGTTTSGPYHTEQIEFWAKRVRMEHQATEVTFVVRDLTKEEEELENSPHAMGHSL